MGIKSTSFNRYVVVVETQRKDHVNKRLTYHDTKKEAIKAAKRANKKALSVGILKISYDVVLERVAGGKLAKTR